MILNIYSFCWTNLMFYESIVFFSLATLKILFLLLVLGSLTVVSHMWFCLHFSFMEQDLSSWFYELKSFLSFRNLWDTIWILLLPQSHCPFILVFYLELDLLSAFIALLCLQLQFSFLFLMFISSVFPHNFQFCSPLVLSKCNQWFLSFIYF